ncbi:unnamed protein product [Sphagnum troendelagicum]|uniref:DAGKc domain-containing protein n=1 Tax=Sphagnum troendelagicum TaxID=128251 RepID=A0ABP0U6T9_9BRYO
MASRAEEEGIITLRNRSGEDESNDRDECSDSTFQRDSDGVQCSSWHCKSSLEKRTATASCGGVFRHQTLPQPLTTPCPPEPKPSTSTAAVASERLPELKSSWMSDSELRTIVKIPNYLAEAMADAVSSKGTLDLAMLPTSSLAVADHATPSCPVLVFINSRSGGLLGPNLFIHLSELISPLQVYDLARTAPGDVLVHGLGLLEKLAEAGDACAQATRTNLRIMVAGGDGTVGWVLSDVDALHSTKPNAHLPPVGIIPLGTGNDLSRSFGWVCEVKSLSSFVHC